MSTTQVNAQLLMSASLQRPIKDIICIPCTMYRGITHTNNMITLSYDLAYNIVKEEEKLLGFSF